MTVPDGRDGSLDSAVTVGKARHRKRCERSRQVDSGGEEEESKVISAWPPDGCRCHFQRDHKWRARRVIAEYGAVIAPGRCPIQDLGGGMAISTLVPESKTGPWVIKKSAAMSDLALKFRSRVIALHYFNLSAVCGVCGANIPVL